MISPVPTLSLFVSLDIQPKLQIERIASVTEVHPGTR